MYNRNKAAKTTIKCNESNEGERIEEKIERILNNREPIKDTAPVVYMDRKDGVQGQYDPRTDKWEGMAENADKLVEARLAIRGTKDDKKVVKLDPKTGKAIKEEPKPTADGEKSPGEK